MLSNNESCRLICCKVSKTMMPELEKLKGFALPLKVKAKKYARSINFNLDIPIQIEVNVDDEFEVLHLKDESQTEYIIFKKVKK